MKKLFTLAAAMLMTFGLYAADKFYALADMTVEGNTYTSQSYSGEKCKNNMNYVELPSASVGGTITFYGQADQTRYLYIYGTAGTVKDESRKMQMLAAGASCDFSAADIIIVSEKPYLLFSTTDDFKFTSFVYTASAADHTKATVKSISVAGEKIAEFDPATLSYSRELAYGTTEAPEVTAVAGNDATIVITPAASIPGATTVKCTSYDETASVTYTINFTTAATPSTDATLKSLSVGGKALADFAPDQYEYNVELEYDATEVPAVVGEKNEDHANVQVNAAAAIPGATTVVVTAQDGTTTLTYTVNFALEPVVPIIRAIHVDGSNATVKGSIGGTSEKSTQSDGKFGSKGHFWGITLAGENTFKAGDVLHVVISKIGQQGTIAVYADNAGSTLLYDTEALGVLGDNQFTLPAAVDGKSSLYIVRTEDNTWYAYVSSISVVRPGTATGIDNTEMNVKAVKTFENGQLVIIKNGVKYNAQGAIVK